jgi:hypothetical protein
MVDNMTANNAQNDSGSKLETVNKSLGAALTYLSSGYGATRRYATSSYRAAREYANRGYEASEDYAKTAVDQAGHVGNNLNELAKKQPVIAMVAVFAAGYAATQAVRSIVTRRMPPKKSWLAAWRR